MPNKSEKATKQEMLSVTTARYTEYYDMQGTFDELYDKSKNGEVFENLTDMIFSRQNILLAYRNIKSNDGSHTPGTDGKTIKDISLMNEESVVGFVRKIAIGNAGYRPKPVRRKDIEKPSGGFRPLGIPCIWDRLVQQCIKQVLEPICEAKFSDNSYGFRPLRSVEHAIAAMYKHMHDTKLYYVVEFDIKSFFDNVNHSKLINQIWALGIHDKKLIWIIKQMLKAPIKMPDGTMDYPTKGTPQGGIISPLLSNIVLNELDQWIDSQWQENPVVYKYKGKLNKNGSLDKGHGYRAMKKTDLKEMYIIRYADDFRIICRNHHDAEKVKIATQKWLQERLKLEISEEKTRIVNVKKTNTEFLGFEIKVHKKGEKYAVISHMSKKAKAKAKEKLLAQTKNIARPRKGCTAWGEIHLYNAMVMGIQNYYKIATHIVDDLAEIGYCVGRTLETRLSTNRGKGRLKKTGRNLTDVEKELYGKSKQIRYESSTGEPIYPIGYVQTKHPLLRTYGACLYTEEGRAKIHSDLNLPNKRIMKQLMLQPLYDKSIQYADNRISLFSMQKGRCAITGRYFENMDEMECHHKKPKELGGTDDFENLVWLWLPVHKLIHATKEETIAKYISEIRPDETQMSAINLLREKAGKGTIVR